MSSAFRVTQRSLGARALSGLQTQLGQLGRIQEQLSSGRLIAKPSDSPTGTVVAMQSRGEIRANEQYGRNASDGLGWLGMADTTLMSSLTSIRRVRDLALQGASTGSSSQTSREALAQEVDSLRDGLLQLANTQYLGRPIFGGTTTGAVAYDTTSGTYAGDTNHVARTVGDNTSVEVAFTGPEVFGPAGSDLFAVVGQIADHLRNDPASLQGDLTALDASMQNVLGRLSEVGARYSRVDAMKTAADDRVLDLKTRLSEVENVDLPKTIMDLQMQQVAYQAALGATSKVITPSLVDFLR